MAEYRLVNCCEGDDCRLCKRGKSQINEFRWIVLLHSLQRKVTLDLATSLTKYQWRALKYLVDLATLQGGRSLNAETQIVWGHRAFEIHRATRQ